MDSPRRRTLLSAGGAALVGVLAGCLDGSGPTGTNDSSNDTDGPNGANGSGSNRNVSDLDTVSLGEAVGTDGGEVTASDVAVRNSLVYEASADALGLASSTGSHYLLVHVAAGESGPAPSEFVLVTDGIGDYEGSTDPTSGNPLRERGPAYRPEEGRTEGWVAFTLPGGVPVEGAAIALGTTGNGWSLTEETTAALSDPVPSFAYEAVDHPERISAGRSFEVRVTVTNESSTDGTVRGALNVTAPMAAATPITLDVPAGESKTFAETYGAEFTGGEEVAFSLTTTAGDRQLAVPVGTAGNTSNASDDGSA